MNKTEQETPFSEETNKFRPHIVYTFFGPFYRPRRLLKGWHLFPLHPIHVYNILHFNVQYLMSHDTGHNLPVCLVLITTVTKWHVYYHSLKIKPR